MKDGGSGIILPRNDPDLIYEAVMKLWQQNQLKEKGKVSRKIVKQNDWDKIADKAVSIYEQMLKKN